MKSEAKQLPIKAKTLPTQAESNFVSLEILQQNSISEIRQSHAPSIETLLCQTVVSFKRAIFSCLGLILWTNILLFWALEESSTPISLYLPTFFNLLITGSMTTAILFRKELLRVQSRNSTSAPHDSTFRDLERDYQKFTFLCSVTLPIMASVACFTIFHITLNLKEGSVSSCPTTFWETLKHLSPEGQAITILYILTYIGIYISAMYTNHLAPKICKLYDERLFRG